MIKIKVLIAAVLLFSFSFSHAKGDYMAYPAMQRFIQHMVETGFSKNYLVNTFSNIKRDENILSLVNSPAEANHGVNTDLYF